MNKILCGIAVCAAALTFGACTETETVYVFPEEGITRLTVSPLKTTMGYIDDAELTVTIRPSTAEYTWESADPSIAVIDENNHIIPQGTGTTQLIAKAGNKTFSVEVTVTSSIVGDTFFIDNGATAKMDNVKIYPEGTPFTVNNRSASIMEVSDDLTVTALSEGVGTVTITTEDNISKTITVGVTDGTVNSLTKANEWLYAGGDLGDGSFNYSVVTFGTNDAVYEGDAKWSGSGKGLALKLYRPSGVDTAPDGTYSAGTGEYNFFADNASYIVDPATGTKDYVKSGEVILDGNNITANVMTTSRAYRFTGSAARPAEKRELLTNYITTIDNDYATGTSQYYVDVNGTVFYGGYTYCWQFRIANSTTNYYLQMFMWGYEELYGKYSIIGSWGGRGTAWVGVSQTTWGSRYREGSSNYPLAAQGNFSLENYSIDESTSTITMDVVGTAYGSSNYTYTIPEINITNSIPHTIEINVKGLEFKKATSRLS